MALSLNKPKLDNLAQNVILPIIVIRRLECVLIDWREKKSAGGRKRGQATFLTASAESLGTEHRRRTL
ncbi:MAG: hypothetical protein EWM73_00594 [Nitrospira sp.]|nr:MAG: hypothetical protein EWM73_00594 [Nitrospira sp.]